MTELTNILNKIKTELHLNRNFEIKTLFFVKGFRNKYVIYYEDTLVQTLHKDQISNIDFNELLKRIHINLFLSRILVKKTICTLKRKR